MVGRGWLGEGVMWKKAIQFYGRFTASFTAIGYVARGLPLRPITGRFDGQTWLVTGATGGIGRAVALGAAKRGAKVYTVGRSQAALEAVQAAGGAGIVPMCFDLEKVADNLALADAIVARGGRVDVLVNNVGKLEHEFGRSAEGFERTYALNLLGHYALTERLMETGALDGGVIVNMASGGLYNAPLSQRLLEQTPETFVGTLAYAAHKRGQLALSDAWSAGPRGIAAYTMHPGWVATEGVRTALPGLNRRLKLVLRSSAQGADTALWLAARRPAPVPGALWFDRAPRSAHAYPRTRTPEVEPQVVFAKLRRDVAKVAGDARRTGTSA